MLTYPKPVGASEEIQNQTIIKRDFSAFFVVSPARGIDRFLDSDPGCPVFQMPFDPLAEVSLACTCLRV